MSTSEIGQAVIDAIIEGGLVRTDDLEPGLLVWSEDADERIGQAVVETAEAMGGRPL